MFAAGTMALLVLDRDRTVRTSKALWIAIVWMSFIGSRTPSQWLGIAPQGSIDQFREGDPFERWFYGLLMAFAIAVLLSRRRRVGDALRSNWPIVVFISFCALSILWSDHPGVTFKRWTKEVGEVAIVLIILTDAHPKAAIKRVLSRVGLLLIATSVLLIRYFTAWGRAYGVGGNQAFTGVTTDKNMLGMVCLIYGIGAVWRVLHLIRDRRSASSNWPLIAQSALLVMVIWLLAKANSMTSISWFAMATALMVVTLVPVLGRKRFVIHITVIALLAVAGSTLFLHVGTGALEEMGRDATLTGRTALWAELAHMNPNVLVGSGFESFWLGDRLQLLWSSPDRAWKPNEAHNGYLEVFLNLGAIGVFLLVIIIATGYRNALRMYRQDPEIGRLQLAYFLVAIGYSFTEAGFRMMTPVWICFMIAVSVWPKPLSSSNTLPSTQAASETSTTEQMTVAQA